MAASLLSSESLSVLLCNFFWLCSTNVSSSWSGLLVSKTTGILDTAKTGLIPSCEVPHKPGTGQGVISGSTQSVFQKTPNNTVLLGAGSKGDYMIEAWICKMDCNVLAYETRLPMKSGTKLKAEDIQIRCRKKESSTWSNYWRTIRIHISVE